MVKNKSAQLKIQQMTFMLIAVTLFFVLVGLFVLSIKTYGLKKIANNLEEENAKLLVAKLANSPEFSCGDVYSYSEINCVDADKVIVLKDRKEYADFWKVANIEIRKIYPVTANKECSLKNYPDCNIIKVFSKDVNAGAYQSNFVSLCRTEILEGEKYDKCELAKILVNYEVKE